MKFLEARIISTHTGKESFFAWVPYRQRKAFTKWAFEKEYGFLNVFFDNLMEVKSYKVVPMDKAGMKIWTKEGYKKIDFSQWDQKIGPVEHVFGNPW